VADPVRDGSDGQQHEGNIGRNLQTEEQVGHPAENKGMVPALPTRSLWERNA
jgi:hypothetical protein